MNKEQSTFTGSSGPTAPAHVQALIDSGLSIIFAGDTKEPNGVLLSSGGKLDAFVDLANPGHQFDVNTSDDALKPAFTDSQIVFDKKSVLVSNADPSVWIPLHDKDNYNGFWFAKIRKTEWNLDPPNFSDGLASLVFMTCEINSNHVGMHFYFEERFSGAESIRCFITKGVNGQVPIQIIQTYSNGGWTSNTGDFTIGFYFKTAAGDDLYQNGALTPGGVYNPTQSSATSSNNPTIGGVIGGYVDTAGNRLNGRIEKMVAGHGTIDAAKLSLINAFLNN